MKEFKQKFKARIFSILQNRMQTENIDDYLVKAGLHIEKNTLSKFILNVALFLNFIISLYLLYRFYILKPGIFKSAFILLVVWTLILILIILGLWVLFYIYLDFKMRMRYMEKKKKPGKPQAEQITLSKRRRRFATYIQMAGMDISLNRMMVMLFRFAIVVNLAINGYMFYSFSEIKPGVLYTVIFTSVLWTLGFLLSLLILWCVFFFYVDYLIYKRRKEIEFVLPDYLQLTAANISAGMTIDRALWFAVRPRFGVLAKEIEDIAKSTIVGENLNDALRRFAKKYDSLLLMRSINLLIEGMESGGELGDLLNRIAQNIQETRIIKREMSANVTTYVIFITFATVVAAPLLFGLSTQLIVIMQQILSSLDLSSLSQSNSGGMSSMFNITGDSINLRDFQIFAITSLSISSIASGVLVSIIRKGNVKDGLQTIPIFFLIAVVIYFISYKLMSVLLGGFF